MASPAFVGLLVISAVTSAGLRQQSDAFAWRDVTASYAAVLDYTALYEKEEQAISGGELQRIRLFFRKPLDVRLEWLDDRGKTDQTAVYREGKNGGKLLARRIGLLGSMIGTLHIDPHDQRALADSRHPITDVGIGHIIESTSSAVASPGAVGPPAVEDTLDRQPAYRFEFDSLSGGLFGVSGARRARVWVDRVLRLPVKVEVLGEGGVVLERHRFRHLQLNNGLTDEVFSL